MREVKLNEVLVLESFPTVFPNLNHSDITLHLKGQSPLSPIWPSSMKKRQVVGRSEKEEREKMTERERERGTENKNDKESYGYFFLSIRCRTTESTVKNLVT